MNIPMNIKLSDAESKVLHLGAVEVDRDLASDVWAVGKLLTRDPAGYTFRVLKSVLQRLWGESNYVDVREVSQNLFLFRFVNTRERNYAVRGGPWIFDRQNVVLEFFRPNDIPSQVPLVKVPYWVQVHGLEVWLRKEKIALQLGAAFAGYIGWDRSDASRFGDFFRVRVWVDVTVPLLRSQMLMSDGGKPFQVFFKYEKLGMLCFRCGFMDHLTQNCNIAPAANESRSTLPYGLWLKAGDSAQPYGRNRNREGEGNRRYHRSFGSNQNNGAGSSSYRRESNMEERPTGSNSRAGENSDSELLDVDEELRKLAAEQDGGVNTLTPHQPINLQSEGTVVNAPGSAAVPQPTGDSKEVFSFTTQFEHEFPNRKRGGVSLAPHVMGSTGASPPSYFMHGY
ncbi:uncharacterized protein LOC130743839 [Lotus japonicus]|uniref:uncharacterized protein LOC130743839 n=1 Tax=Lotus japonicus TaxID=34305 RepID=UPI002590FF7A|nr:uncharacterized protein LOC130743839 [Lotus japonicus]